MTDSPLRMAVIGAGSFVTRRHLPVMVDHPEMEVVALCRRDQDSLRQVAEHFNVDRTYTDYEEMLARETLDAVLIATPHGLHYPHTRAALEKGLHVCLEKPMAVWGAEARELQRMADEGDLVLQVALNAPFWAHCHRMRERMNSEAFGELESAHLHWCVSSVSAKTDFGRKPMPTNLPGVVPPSEFRSDPQLSGGGNLLDGGSHLISGLLWTTGHSVTSASAQMDAVPLDKRASVVLEMNNGALVVVSFIADSASSRKRVREAYFGSGALLEADGQPFELRWETEDGEVSEENEDDWAPVPQPVENFLNVIRGRAENLSPADHGAEVVEVMEAIYRSAKEGKVIRIEKRGSV